GLCGNFDGEKDNDLRTRNDPLYISRANEKNHGVLMGNSWKTSLVATDLVKDDSINMDAPWRDLHNWRRAINKLELIKRHCQYADCGGEVGTHKWESCVADTYYASAEQECHILETNIFAKSSCSGGEFNCSAIVVEGRQTR
ncbi:unnamed protein product, partial [Owenia fusiformis]